MHVVIKSFAARRWPYCYKLYNLLLSKVHSMQMYHAFYLQNKHAQANSMTNVMGMFKYHEADLAV